LEAALAPKAKLAPKKRAAPKKTTKKKTEKKTVTKAKATAIAAAAAEREEIMKENLRGPPAGPGAVKLYYFYGRGLGEAMLAAGGEVIFTRPCILLRDALLTSV
jgi:hypothetical protein